MKFGKFLIALLMVLVLGSCSYADIIYTTSDYSNSTIGLIKGNNASVQNSFADGDPRIIPFNDGTAKLAVALRGTLGSLSIYDQNDLSNPQTQTRIGASINGGVFYKGNLFILDMGDMMSNKGDAKLFKLDEKLNIKNELNLQTSATDYKFYAEKIIENDGFLFVLMQRRKNLGSEWPYVDHEEGELLKIDPGTLEIKHRWTLNKNPMDMVSLNQDIYVVSIGGAQGIDNNLPKLQVINILTEAISEIALWSKGSISIPSTLDEPQKITADQSSGEIYIAVSGLTDAVAYKTDSAIYKLNPSDISSLEELSYSQNGSITCMEYDPADSTIMTLFSDYSSNEGNIKIYEKDGSLKKSYSSTELGGSAYQAILTTSGNDVTPSESGGGCNSGLPFFAIFMLVPILFASPVRKK